jgi:cystathionine beta-lyase/cystathionine gamma-synthase
MKKSQSQGQDAERQEFRMENFRTETQAVRGGTDLAKRNGPLATPIYQTATFEAVDMDEQERAPSTDMFYTRYGNPTHTVAESAIAQLERTDAALLFASGMAAITTTILALLKSGDHVVAQHDIYGGATRFFAQWLPKLGIETTFVEATEYDQHARALKPNTKLIYLESPTNPTLRVVDLAQVAALAKRRGILSMVDSTFATPVNQRPAEFGIDLIMHSGTKYFAGHSDLVCGIVAGRSELIETIHQTRTTLGGVMDPHAAWLLLRGIKTLAVRVERQNQSALRIAEFLAAHSKVRRVYYPFAQRHPQRDLAMAVMRGGGGVLSFEVEGTGEDARRFAESLHLFTLAPSLGGVESLVTIPVITSHGMVSAEHRQKMGVTERLVRLSVGIEHADDLIADIDQALSVVGSATRQVAVG